MPRISGERRGDGVQAVVFALEILEFLAQQQNSVGVTELARAFDTTKSRMHRHLQTLVGAGYILREDDTERYRVSTRLMALGRAVSDNFELTAVARPVMRQMRDALGHPVVLSRPVADGVNVLAMLTGQSTLEVGVKVGSTIEYHTTAQGKVALAFGDESTRLRVLNGTLAQATPQTNTDPVRLSDELTEIHEKGWASSPNQALIGLNALAAPIFDAGGVFVGCVALVDSIQFLGEPPTKDQIALVVDGGRRISRELGYRLPREAAA
ncbi:IclR family transcriptional regulator [Microbaculum marinum]|uniref:IclR family transcriptional regulator n=1 Tax=Microbaculum marinum TaxID=1764581 RepID=A0AAW9RXI0_9HYPH